MGEVTATQSKPSSELGIEAEVLPLGWDVRPLGTLADLRRNSINPEAAPHLPYVGLEHIDSGDPKLKRWGNPAEIRSAKSHFYAGDVLYGKLRPYLDKAVLADFEGMCSTDVLVLRPNEDIDQGFFANLLHTSAVINHAIATTTGVNHPRTSWSSLRKLEVTIPPLPEQRAIAHILRTVQRAKEATERVIAATRELKKSLLKHLFTYGPVPVGQADRVVLKETNIGSVPAHWEMMRLGYLGKIGNGSTPKRSNPAYWEGGTIPWLTSGKVHDVIIRQADEFVTDLARKECHLPLVEQGSIVIAITGQGKTLGNAALVTFDTCVSQHLAYIRIPPRCADPDFVLAYLHHQYEGLRRVGQSGGSTKGALTCGQLKLYPLPLPLLEEQRKIAHILRAADSKIMVEEDLAHSLGVLFRSLLQQLMTGKVRVVDLAHLASEAAD